jgi:hypothetical protein
MEECISLEQCILQNSKSHCQPSAIELTVMYLRPSYLNLLAVLSYYFSSSMTERCLIARAISRHGPPQGGNLCQRQFEARDTMYTKQGMLPCVLTQSQK